MIAWLLRPAATLAILVWAGQHACLAANGDAQRFCDPKGANLVLLLDVTTPYDDIDKTALIGGVGHIFEELKGGEHIVIRTIEDTFSNSRRLMDACVPYCPSSGFFGDLFSSCTEGVVINEKKALRRNLVQQMTTLLDGAHELDHSEIIRTLATALKEEGHADTENRIFVFSDMIENSAYLSGHDFFASGDGKLIERLERDSLLPAAWQADVRVFGIGRTGTPGNRTALPQDKLKKLTAFWTKYFAAGGGTLHMSPNLDLN
jgi:hypothetical protein